MKDEEGRILQDPGPRLALIFFPSNLPHPLTPLERLPCYTSVKENGSTGELSKCLISTVVKPVD